MLLFHYRNRRTSKKNKKTTASDELKKMESEQTERYSFHHPELIEDTNEEDQLNTSDDYDWHPLPVKEKYPAMPDDVYDLPQDRLNQLHDRTDEFLDQELQRDQSIEQMESSIPNNPMPFHRAEPVFGGLPKFKKPMIWLMILIAIVVSVYVGLLLVSYVLPSDFLFIEGITE